MTADGGTHEIRLALGELAEAPVGTEVAVTVRASCPVGCDLAGLPVEMAAPDGTTAMQVLARDPDSGEAIAPVALRMPARVGVHCWTFSCPACERGGRLHQDAALTVTIAARPFGASLAIWAVPSPIVVGELFSLKAGAKSAGGHDLGGCTIEVRDAAGATVASGTLRATPWPDTAALYWTELSMTAPPEPGLSSWSVRFAASDAGPPHDAASCGFTLATVAPPDHSLTVTVVEKNGAAPVSEAWVRAGDVRAATDAAGRVELKLPKGAYDVVVWKVGYDAPPLAVELQSDREVTVEATTVPEEDPDARWRA